MYETGVAADPTDLLKKLVTFLVGAGWASNMSAADGTGWRAHLSKGDQYVNLRSNIGDGSEEVWAPAPLIGAPPIVGLGGLSIYCGTGFSGTENWRTQPGGPLSPSGGRNVGGCVQLGAGPVASHHFFADADDNITAVVEKSAGVFVALGWGHVSKVGGWAGSGQFFHATMPQGGLGHHDPDTPRAGIDLSQRCPFCFLDAVLAANCGWVRCDVDSFTDQWCAVGASGETEYYAYTGRNLASPVPNGNDAPPAALPHYNYLADRLTSALSNQATLLPIHLYANRDAGGVSLWATVPSLYCTNAVGNGFAAKSVLALGADSYMLFPNFAVKKVA